MSYSNNNYSSGRSYGAGRNNSYSGSQEVAEIKAESLPENYIDLAEKVIKSYAERGEKTISTSKLRNLLSLVSDIYNVENISKDKTLSAQSMVSLSMFRIRAVYESGREEKVKDFVKNAKILEYVKGLGNSKENLINFAHYMEALVAYHRYYGVGKDN